MLRSQNCSSALTTAINRNNPWAKRPIKEIKEFDSFAKLAKKIEDQFESDSSNIKTTKQRLTKTGS